LNLTDVNARQTPRPTTYVKPRSTLRTRHNIVIPTEVSRCFLYSFAPAKESAYAVEESLFELSTPLSCGNLQNMRSH